MRNGSQPLLCFGERALTVRSSVDGVEVQQTKPNMLHTLFSAYINSNAKDSSNQRVGTDHPKGCLKPISMIYDSTIEHFNGYSWFCQYSYLGISRWRWSQKLQQFHQLIQAPQEALVLPLLNVWMLFFLFTCISHYEMGATISIVITSMVIRPACVAQPSLRSSLSFPFGGRPVLLLLSILPPLTAGLLLVLRSCHSLLRCDFLSCFWYNKAYEFAYLLILSSSLFKVFHFALSSISNSLSCLSNSWFLVLWLNPSNSFIFGVWSLFSHSASPSCLLPFISLSLSLSYEPSSTLFVLFASHSFCLLINFRFPFFDTFLLPFSHVTSFYLLFTVL